MLSNQILESAMIRIYTNVYIWKKLYILPVLKCPFWEGSFCHNFQCKSFLSKLKVRMRWNFNGFGKATCLSREPDFISRDLHSIFLFLLICNYITCIKTGPFIGFLFVDIISELSRQGLLLLLLHTHFNKQAKFLGCANLLSEFHAAGTSDIIRNCLSSWNDSGCTIMKMTGNGKFSLDIWIQRHL